MDHNEWMNLSLEDLVEEEGNYTAGFLGFLLVEQLSSPIEKPYSRQREVLVMIDEVPEQIPEEEFTKEDMELYGALIRAHRAHRMISVIPTGISSREAAEIYQQVLEEQLNDTNVLCIYHNGTILTKDSFRNNKRENPLKNRIAFRFRGNRAFTTGLDSYGLDELELIIPDSGACNEASNLMAAESVLVSLAQELLNGEGKKNLPESVWHCGTDDVEYRLQRIECTYQDGHALLLKPIETK